MGCTNSQISAFEHSINFSSRYWRPIPTASEAKSLYHVENYNQGQLEFRTLLDYPLARQYFIIYLKTIDDTRCQTSFDGWVDIETFNKLAPAAARTSMAFSIFNRHVKSSGIFSVDIVENISSTLSTPELILPTIFDAIQSSFFDLLYTHMFVDFKISPEYKSMCSALRRKYNSVKESDFVCHQVLGRGGFGVVCEVTKKSTMRKYAMKLQSKAQLNMVFRGETWRAEAEKRAFASCNHPFIVELFFAFQTPSLVAMVMNLSGQDLSRIIRTHGPLSCEHTRFYAAEVTAALSYLHHKGFVYRDLKPANILLSYDGHIELTDFGGVCDVTGQTLGMHHALNAVLPVLQKQPTQLDIRPLTEIWKCQVNEKARAAAKSTSKKQSVPAPPPVKPPPRTLSTFGLLKMTKSVGGKSSRTGFSKYGPDYTRLRALCSASEDVHQQLLRQFPALSAPTILRHLLICEGNFSKTVAHIETCQRALQARIPVDNFRNWPGVPEEFCYIHGHDNEGHPLMILRVCLMDRKVRDKEHMMRWMHYMVDVAIARMPSNLMQFTILSIPAEVHEPDFEIGILWDKLSSVCFPVRVFKHIFYPAPVSLRKLKPLYSSSTRLQYQGTPTLMLGTLAEVLQHIPVKYIPTYVGGSCTYEYNSADFRSYADGVSMSTIDENIALDFSIDPRMKIAPEEPSLLLSKVDNDDDDDDVAGARSKSLVGTLAFMAPEMMILMINADGFTHRGYTKAVDWWSLGVTMYKLLTCKYPFSNSFTDWQTTVSDRYTSLHEKVDYSSLNDIPDLVDLLAKLLHVDEPRRLGYGNDGSRDVSSHPFFSSIDWVQLENKMVTPPELPYQPEAASNKKGQSIDEFTAGLPSSMALRQFGDSAEEQQELKLVNEQLEGWDYTSPAAVLVELENSSSATLSVSSPSVLHSPSDSVGKGSTGCS